MRDLTRHRVTGILGADESPRGAHDGVEHDSREEQLEGERRKHDRQAENTEKHEGGAAEYPQPRAPESFTENRAAAPGSPRQPGSAGL